MFNMELKKVFHIVQCAIDLHARENIRKEIHPHLRAAYSIWRHENGTTEHITRGDAEWELMMRATKPEYKALETAKAAERRVRKRLSNAVVALQGDLIASQFTGARDD